jgi:uncharacterized repeat protein (TIGR01451 family)
VNGSSELGRAGSDTCGTLACSTTPAQVSGLAGLQTVAAGGDHSLAVTLGGAVYAWGLDADGQVGTSTTANCQCISVPTQVSGLPTTVVDVAGGDAHSLALTVTGAVYAWGRNADGQLGNGTTTSSTTPVQVTGLPGNIVAISAGSCHSLALTADGLVYAWGCNGSGQLGTGGTSGSTTPARVAGLSGVTAIATRSATSLALTASGAVYAWGDNTFGQLGTSTTTNSSAPAQVGISGSVTAIAAGGSHSLALSSTGAVYAWGRNDFGQLGATTSQTCGSSACSTTPVAVSGLPTNVTKIAGGNAHSLALTSSITVYAWGANTAGQLGLGSSDTAAHPAPAPVSGLTGVSALAAGGDFSLTIVNPVASISTTFINFGDQAVGTTSPDQDVTLTNTGIVPLTITNAALGGPNLGDFTLAYGVCPSASPTAAVIAPGGSCTLNVSFAPTKVGTRTATLTVTSDAINGTLNGSVTGNGISPTTGFSPSSVTFTGQYVGTSSAPQTITVSNSGTATLTVSAVAIAGANAGDFSVSAPALPFSIAPGSSATLMVTFAPANGPAGARTGILNLTDNDYLHPQSVALSGTALLPADLSVGLSASPSPVKNGASLTYTITVRNGGPGVSSNAAVSDALPPGTDFASVGTTLGNCSAPAVGGTGTVTCTASSLDSGASYSVTLVVTVNARGGSTLSDTASVSAGTLDPNSANNLSSVTTSVYGKH